MRRLFFASQESFSLFTTTVAFTATFGGIAGCGSDQPPAPADVSGDTTSVWAEAAFRGIAAGEYAPQADGAGFRVSNRAQKLQGVFGERGLTVSGQSGGDVSLELRAWGREQTLAEVSPTVPEQGPCLVGGATDAVGECLHRVDYVRPGLTEWWENRPEGLEQGFTVMVPPAGDGAMVFDLTITGASVEVGATEAVLVAAGGARFRFSGLHAYDSRGWDLPAWMESSNGGIRLLVDDSDAVGVVTVDPLLTTSAWTSEVNVAGANLGYSVASAGDVDANGFSDVIVGAPGYNAGTSGGAAFLYLGSASGLASTAAWTATGGAANMLFGASVATGGDVDGDGDSEVIVGAPGHNSTQGKVFVYYFSMSGSPPTLGSTSWSYVPTKTAGKFGSSVACAGDVNGNGYADIVVGAPDYTNSQTNEGAAYLFKGSATGLGSSAWLTVESNVASAGFGGSVASAGDFDADGYSDVVVGASTYTYTSDSTTYTAAGAAFLYFGSGSGISDSAAWTAQGDQASAKFGTSVASAGDVNGDGYGDLIVGAPLYDSTLTDEGKAFVYFGSASPPSSAGTADWTTVGGQDSAQLGQAVASAGDVNGDGYGDVIIGAPYYENGDTDEGRAYTYPGSASGPVSSIEWIAESDSNAALMGYSVASAGDVNGDGYGDVIVGAYGLTNGSSSEGRAYAYSGSEGTLFYADEDSDGRGDPENVVEALVAPSGWVTSWDDCDDNATTGSLRSPMLAEIVADGIDQDCDELELCYADADGDGWGDDTPTLVESSSLTCLLPGVSTDNSDCDDTNSDISPFATEVPSNDVDDNCDDKQSCYGDLDDDGFLKSGALTVYTTGTADADCADAYEGESGDLRTDCDDTSPLVNPGATEIPSNRIDDNCDSKQSCYWDVDNDGYLTTGDLTVYETGTPDADCDAPYEGAAEDPLTDCDDTLASVYPGAPETTADSKDQNCDGFDNCYKDVDNDNYGVATVVVGDSKSCDTGSGSMNKTDCDDTVDSIYPSAPETVGNSIDEDCDGVDSCYQDADGDNYGSSTVLDGSSKNCTTGTGAPSGGDCNEGDRDINPGASEIVGDNVDQNCDFKETCYTDGDNDGSRTAVVVVSTADTSCKTADGEALAVAPIDCDDGNSAAYVGASEIVGNEVDNDCDGKETCYVDLDDDDYRPDSTSTVNSADKDCLDAGEATSDLSVGDCDDSDSAFNPSALEVDCGATDYNCDGLVGYVDADGDGYAKSCGALQDCNDGDVNIRPLGREYPGDGIDGDCDKVDDCYVDEDDDGYGTAVVVTGTTEDCTGVGEAPESLPAGVEDCDDVSVGVNPGASELAGDGVNSDCVTGELCYVDADLDGYRSETKTVVSGDNDCTDAGEALADIPIDCDDVSDVAATINPLAPEVAGDGVDQDCDGFDLCYVDADGDEYRTNATVVGTTEDCTGGGEAPSTAGKDCDDDDASINPEGVEVFADGIDGDCDRLETCFYDADGDGYVNDDIDLDGDVDDDDLAALEADLSLPAAERVYSVESADPDCSDPFESLNPFTNPVYGGDCDDSDAAYNPGASESDCADPTDYNCDGSVAYEDFDGDGFTACNDCNDTAFGVNSDATELPGDGVDQDCDGEELCYIDGDDDGYRLDPETTFATVNISCDGTLEVPAGGPADCDDADAAVSPGAAEIVGDELDQDCDGTELCFVDADFDSYPADGVATIVSSDDALCDAAGEATAAALAVGADCADDDPARYPGAPEEDCGDSVDYNCDGSSGTVDADQDGFGACYDCDDASSSVNDNAVEVCNRIDDDCDQIIDEDAADASTWYADIDGDGYSDRDSTLVACDQPDGFIPAATRDDCDDADATSFPGGDDVPQDGVDQDCDGEDAAFADTGTGADDESGSGSGDADTQPCGCASSGGPGAAGAMLIAAFVMGIRRRRLAKQAS